MEIKNSWEIEGQVSKTEISFKKSNRQILKIKNTFKKSNGQILEIRKKIILIRNQTDKFWKSKSLF